MKRKPPERYKWKNSTPRVKARAKQRDGSRVIARGKVMRISASVQAEYVNAVVKLVEQMQREVRRDLSALFKKDFAKEHFATDDTVGMDASVSSQARILTNAFKKRYDQLFGSIAPDLARQMTDRVNKNSEQQATQSAKDLPNLKVDGQKLTISMKTLDKRSTEILKSSTAGASSFITSIPEKYLNGVADATFRSITTGNGLQDLIPYLDKQDVSLTNWAHNTAMDQTRKAFNGLNKGRMQKIGITKGEWIHSGGSQHPRPLHEAFDGKTFDLAEGAPVGDDDGNNVDPGEEPNCRCAFAPVIAEDDTEQEEGDD